MPTTRSGCDSIIFVGLGLRRAGSSEWLNVDEQAYPVRGLGTHTDIDLVGVAERLQPGDSLALLIYGHHPQYFFSYSRDASIPVVNVSAELRLPVYAAKADGTPDFGFDPANAIVGSAEDNGGCTDPAAAFDPACAAEGTAIHALRSYCDYNWIPELCAATDTDNPDYQVGDDPSPNNGLFLATGAVHNHSGYSDGDPTAIPADYFRAGREGHNLADNGVDDTGVRLDFMISSEHSDNEKLPATTAAVCVEGYADPATYENAFNNQDPTALAALLNCAQFDRNDHYFKWQATLEQAIAGTQRESASEPRGAYLGFTAMRGFEYTNDYYNHLNVYLSRNVINTKNDGSFASLDQFWNWLKEPVAEGGGADALVTFNHPGGNPSLSPFDGGQPHNEILNTFPGGGNWNDLRYVDAEVDARVFGMEVNGGDDLYWYRRALQRGWHISPVAAEDEHQREWASTGDGKTVILTRGRSPRDYYYALSQRRSYAVNRAAVSGQPGTGVQVPSVQYWAGGSSIQNGAPMGSIIDDLVQTTYDLNLNIAGVPAGARIALVGTGNSNGAFQVGRADATGRFASSLEVQPDRNSQSWYYVVVCRADAYNCGGTHDNDSDFRELVVTAPIWFGASEEPTAEEELIAAYEQFSAGLAALLAALQNGDPQTAVAILQGSAAEFAADILRITAVTVGEQARFDLIAPQPGNAAPFPEPEPLLAGVAKAPLRVPVGVPLGGYLRPPVGGDFFPAGEELGEGDFEGGFQTFVDEFGDFIPAQDDNGMPLAPVPDELRAVHSPYATYSPPSRGYYDSLITKAVALYDGNDCVVMMKTDFIGMLDEVVVAVAEDVQARHPELLQSRMPGCDLAEGMLASATHTHDGPGAVANNSTRYFWLAVDAYQPELFERLVRDLADVVVAAIEDLQPARFGHASGVEQFRNADGSINNLNGFRRSRSPWTADQVNAQDAMRKRLAVLRVDRLDGRPLAAVINYAAHGIAFDVENLFFSGDVLGAAEREMELSVGGEFPTEGGADFVAMLVQNTGGDVSPRGRIGNTTNKLQVIERFGKQLAPQARSIFDSIDQMQSAPDLRIVSKRVILSLDTLGYAPGEYPYPWGAAQCNNEAGVPFVGPSFGESIPYCIPAPPPDLLDLADNGVAENGAFVPQDTRVTVAKIGDAYLISQPGEPLAEQGVRILDAVAGLNINPQNTYIWGYAQDHVGYVLPDEKADWDLGGTEGTTTFWGWKQGGLLLDVATELMTSLRDRSARPTDDFTVNYDLYRDVLRNTPAPQATPSIAPGSIKVQPGDIRRFATTSFAFEGGDPIIDLPTVTMEILDDNGVWQPMRRANGEIIDTYFEMHIEYVRLAERHLWVIEFEAPKDWAAGNYRFSVVGQALNEPAAAGATTPYSMQSDAFAVTHSETLLVSTPQAVSGGYEVSVAYRAHPDNYRLIDVLTPMDQPAPVRAGAVLFSNGIDQVLAPAAEIRVESGIPVAYYRAAINDLGNGITTTATDAFGNISKPVGGAGPVDNPPPETGATLVAYCYDAAGDNDFCEQFEDQTANFAAQCRDGADFSGGAFSEEDAENFCRTFLQGDLDAAIAFCDANAGTQPAVCSPIQSLADVLATRNVWLARKPLNISHRGGADEFPENTLYAYAESLKAGSNMLEADVYQTADGEIVVIHDASVDRTTDGTGSVSSKTLAELKALDAAFCHRQIGEDQYGQRFTASCADGGDYPFRGIATGAVPPPPGYSADDFKIPTLREMLARFPDTLINLELKPDPQGAGTYEGNLASILAEFGRSEDVIVASFLDTAAAAFKAQAPLVSTAVPTAQVAASIAAGAGPSPGITVGHEAFEVPVNFNGVPVINQEFVDDAHAQGLAVYAWTIDDCDEMVDLLDLGVEGIMTDRPSLLTRVINDRATKPRAEWICQGGEPPPPPVDDDSANPYGTGVLGSIAQFFGNMADVFLTLFGGDFTGAGDQFQTALTTLADGLGESLLGDDDSAASTLAAAAAGEDFLAEAGDALGLGGRPDEVLLSEVAANREVEAVVIEGAQLPGWSAPAAAGFPNPYPSGADINQCPDQLGPGCQLFDGLTSVTGQLGAGALVSPVRNAHNGVIAYPAGWTLGDNGVPGGGVPIDEIAAYAFKDSNWVEIPVQVDERMPYFLANGNSTFSIYSGTDEELTYVWRSDADPAGYWGEEAWGMTAGACARTYDPDGWDVNPNGIDPDTGLLDRNRGLSRPTPDPVAGLDHDDEIVIMASDAGDFAGPGVLPPVDGLKQVQMVTLADANDPATQRVVYLVQRDGGSQAQQRYVDYQRAADADQWIDRSFFNPGGPQFDPLNREILGSSNVGYGANLTGTICYDYDPQTGSGTPVASTQRGVNRPGYPLGDRFPRDGVTVTTSNYQWQASGRWMIRELKVRGEGEQVGDPSYWDSRPDLIDRWKGRAFQQSPDSNISLVGFEDEQINWEGNASLLGERCGPVRCMREVWGADSGTNVTKLETFYRDAIAYRYRVRVHPIPPDGLYTSWEYNRGVMLPTDEESEAGVEGGRYYTVLRPQGVPVDGQNDDVGQIDSTPPFPGANVCPSSDFISDPVDGSCPTFFDAADPTFNLPLAFDNWEQVSGKGGAGSLVYIFELTGPTSLATPLVVPYYRDDACLDDGTGDDPVARPHPGERSTDSRVTGAYSDLNGDGEVRCEDGETAGVYGAHGIHYFLTGDVDNAFLLGKPINEIDGQQWQFMVPTSAPRNEGARHANVVRTPLQPVAVPLPVSGGDSGGGGSELACTADNSQAANYSHLIGSLHQHSGFSDGAIGTSPADYYAAGRAAGLDFVAGSDHSDNAMLPITANTDCGSERLFECFQAPPEGLQKWNTTAGLADAATVPGEFSAVRGFEWTSDRFGHINVFFSSNDLNAKTSTGYALSMEDFWLWLDLPAESVNGIGGGADGLAVFNHPGREDQLHAFIPDPAYAFNNLAYRPEHDARVVGIEAFGKSSDYYDSDNGAPPGGWYAHALDQGWHLGAVGSEDHHDTDWSQPRFAKTVFIAEQNSRSAIREAMQARRFYALGHNHNDLRLSFSANGLPMGSRIGVAAGSSLQF